MLTSGDAPLFATASIAFDLDGTLVDTAPDLVRALNAIIQPRGLAPVPLDDVRAMVGRGARALLQRAFERSGRALEDGDALVAEFIRVYGDAISMESRVFPGVEDTLAWLQAQGASLSVCTNKPSVLSDRLIAEVGLAGYFDRIVGPERTAARKPAPDHVRDALGTGYQRAALVGDSAPDVGAASAAGIPSIVMSYGYSENPAGSLGASRVVHAFRDVPQALADLWRA
ncbi:HAD hydrolase-like protein [Maricaulis sp.]|uniref:HAD hydrolase-like protein n=1 Tax=Maricaulis sp. TaxID=1486257 RepID=UPI00262CFD1B|nr:HAD hydrolase-like protein [Maricaulis sp.]